MFGLLHALATVATLLLMCDGRDLGTAIGERPPAPESRTEIVEAQDVAPLQGPGMSPRMTSHRRDSETSRAAILRNFSSPISILTRLIPAGSGFSEPLFRAHNLLVNKTRELIAACTCEQGCPSCVGPAGDLAPRAKEAALAILDRLRG